MAKNGIDITKYDGMLYLRGRTHHQVSTVKGVRLWANIPFSPRLGSPATKNKSHARGVPTFPHGSSSAQSLMLAL